MFCILRIIWTSSGTFRRNWWLCGEALASSAQAHEFNPGPNHARDYKIVNRSFCLMLENGNGIDILDGCLVEETLCLHSFLYTTSIAMECNLYIWEMDRDAGQ